ncbi:GRIP and coiled-coil domain-containing protein 2 isoform X1 [Scophthalmus maximus]|uniref:GRIP and coiled-coil domain-containing protein 2 isoform X1 n=2 Tax=Scophthalmus maximus TaxID=52904 RepID=UPI0015E0F6EE|nr:GRIP and coiled-coil domain-containing protein 2 isoform X1 [Scophthalmus maximus]
MEQDPDGTGAESAAPSPAGAARSKLDTLSKDDLIKFAKKQIAAMQKMKGKYADLEREVASFKHQSKSSNGSSDDATLIQELTDRMDALLLEKAEVQQSLVMSRKDLERTKKQAKDDLVVLQGKLDHVIEDHQRNIKELESSIKESNNKHQEEVAYFQKLLKEREESDRDSERERERQAEHAGSKESAEEVRRCIEVQLQTLRAELEATHKRKTQEVSELQESHQRDLTEAQQEVENLKEELAQKSLQHEEEMRALEEDCEIERDRLLLLHDELTEQLALKDSYLQDVQEEDEDPTRGSGIAKMLALSGLSQGDSSHVDGEESSRLRAGLDDLQAQNTMLQDELTLLGNVKSELEAELERAREEFQLEREELEFKVNELQMTRESSSADAVMTLDPDHQQVQGEAKDSAVNREEQQKLNQELRDQCETLTRDRDSALAECQHMREILQGVETELVEKTKAFVLQYEAMKEKGAFTLRELQDIVQQLSQERDALLVRVKDVTEENNTLTENMAQQHLKPEGSPGGDQKLQASLDEQTALSRELKLSVEELTRQNEETLAQMQMNEDTTQDLKEMVNTLTEDRDKIQSLLQVREEEMQKLNNDIAKELERLLEEKEREALLLTEEKEKELKCLRKEKEDEVKHLNEEGIKMEESLKEEVKRRQETVAALEQTIKGLAAEKTDLHQKLEEASSELAKAQEERGLSGSKLAALEAQLEQETSDKRHLEVKLNSASEEAEQAHTSNSALEEKMNEVVKNSTDEVEKLRARVDELEQERDLLKSSVEEARGERRPEEVQHELQAHIKDLEQERNSLRYNVKELAKDNEGLQKDLLETKSVGEKISEENQTLQARISLMTEEKEREALLLKEEKEKELKRLRKEKEDEVKHLNEEGIKMEESLKEEVKRRQETVAALEQTIKELAAEKTDLHQKLEEASSELAKAQEERGLSGSKLAALEAQLEQETSDKRHLEVKLNSASEEAEQAHTSNSALEEKMNEVVKNSTDEVEELRARVDELEQERDLLKSSLEEARGERRPEEVQHELQAHIKDLEQERNALRNNVEELAKDNEGLQKDLLDMKSVGEKISEENQTLQARISLMTEEKEEKEKGETENVEKESGDHREQLVEKDSLISQLRIEMAALQESAAQSASSGETAANEITQKIAILEKENKEKNDKMHKIKAVAVKAKKELDVSKKEIATLNEEVESLRADREKVNSSMKDIIHGAEGYKNLQIDYDRQTEQLDKEREKVEAAERQIAELTKRLSSAVTQKETLNGEKEDLLAGVETIRSTVRQLEAQNQELQRHSASLDRDLLAERAMKEQKIKDLSSANKEVEELTAQLHKQQQQSQQTAQELEQLRKEAQQNSLMDMEMADYERLVKDLNTKLSEGDKCADELKTQINVLSQKEDALKQEIKALKSQLDQGDDKTSKMKQLLVKTKKDLADAKKQESSLMMLQASLTGELEANQQQLESLKIEVCELSAERHRQQEQLRSASEQQQRTCSSLQHRINSLLQERDDAKAELVATTGEFEGYKVRVHNVLKQQKTKTTAQSEGETGKLEREHLSSQVDQLKSRLAESQQSLQSSMAELQQLQNEHDTLLERHNKILQETVSKEAELRERLLSVQSENMALRSDLSQAQADLLSQVEAQRQAYREQLRKVQDDHRATVETLQSQLTRFEEQLFTLQSQNISVSVQSSRKPLASDPLRRNTDQNQTGLGLVGLNDLQSMAREEGEGMETTESESPSPALTPLPSLEQLLMSPNPKQEPFVWTVEPTKQELSQKLTTATRSMEHMNSLLHETEATNAVLMEQITLLKSEVRRLERNQEREKSVANLEYLKNVLLQFIFLRSGSERQGLLPVIHTMLQLSPEEKSKLAAIAQGEEEGSGSRGSGWTSYLHSWSGIR